MTDQRMWKRRLLKILASAIIFVIFGSMYAVFVQKTGMAVPCLFHTITGLQCPGCGITRMCVALFRLDFITAFKCNQALFCLMPVLGIVFLKYLVDYIKTGKMQLSRWQNNVLYICIAILVIFGIVRNIL